ncbi:MAG: PadR family transcriptional regulator [Demequinaceae bacterium]|nr:PadR family transcriptional regulator [Demequinaceae bacterium]
MTSHDPQMLKGLVSLLLLDLLAEESDYGYSLVVRLQGKGFTDLAEGTIYPALARVEQAGWIEAYLVASEKGPARKYYRITASGQKERQRAREAWENLVNLVRAAADKGDGPTTRSK